MAWRLPALIAILILLSGCSSPSDRLRTDLKSPDPMIRAKACERLGQLKDRNAVPLLIELLADTIAPVRLNAALALAKIKDEMAIPHLAQRAEKETLEEVVEGMMRAFFDFGPAAIEPLIELSNSLNPLVRMGACQVLGKIGAHQAVEPLIRRLDDPDFNVRRAAIIALRRIGDHRGLEAIARKVQGPDQATEETAEEALSGRGYEEQLDRIKHILQQFRH